MCGLFASAGLTPDRARIDIVAHRGPDGEGWAVHDSPSGPVALGHRRLAIIDLSTDGAQPMEHGEGRFHLVYNGEIYNYIELRRQLQERGEVFRTASDSEVLLRVYTVWGPDGLSRLRGMFAFVILDKHSGRMFAARDRYGIKPLYFAAGDGFVAFGSEIKQLLDLPDTRRRMNVARVHDFLASGMSDHSADTLFDGVHQLRGGEMAQVDLAGGRARLAIGRWYQPTTDRLPLTEDRAVERFGALVGESMRLHLRSDVTIGSCLSGGLDSSSIVGFATTLLPAGTRMETVSACYPGESVDERRFVDAVVDRTGVGSRIVTPRADDVMAMAERITWHQDEPFGSTSIIAQWLVFSEARKAGIKVMLDGQGADEQLGGYHFMFPHHVAGLLRRGRVGEALAVIRARMRVQGVSGWTQALPLMAALLPGSLSAGLRQRRLGWLGGPAIREKGNPDGSVATASAAAGLPLPTDLASLCDLMVHASNLPMLLHWEDRSSMAHGIEARVPFLDPPLVAFSLALGNEHKMVGAETKRVLRRALGPVLPRAVLDRKDKLGFATPEQRWFRAELRGFVHDGVEKTLSLYPDLFAPAPLRALRDSMLTGAARPDPVLWRIVNLGIWGDRFKVGLG